jgi:dihydrofolate reductase
VVLSRTLDADADDKVSVVRDLDEADARLGSLGAQRVYIDGGRTIQACLAAGWVDELVISRVPVLLGTGVPLFGPLPGDVDLEHVRTDVLGGGMVQTTYRVVR